MRINNRFSNSNMGFLLWLVASLMVSCIVVSGVFYSIGTLINYPSHISDKYESNEETEDTEDQIPEGTVGTLRVTGYKDEYYLNESFDFDNVITINATYYNKGTWVLVTIDKDSDFKPSAYIKGYVDETSLPHTNTLGTHTFTITYLNSEAYCSYTVVEFNPYHLLNFINGKTIGNTNSMLNIHNTGGISINSDVSASNFVENISSSVYYDSTAKKHKTFHYLNSIESIMSMAVKYGSVNTPNYTPDGETTNSTCQKNGNTYTGAMWTSFYYMETNSVTYEYFTFTIEYSQTTCGIKVVIETTDKTTELLANFKEECFNLCVILEEDYDILLNYSEDTYSYATISQGQYSDLNNTNYDENFANLGISSLVYNVSENTHTYNV